jgi:hypothetical protein
MLPVPSMRRVTDCLYAKSLRKLVVSSMDRSVSFYDINRGSYEMGGRVYASGAMGAPLTLCSLQVTGAQGTS